MNAQDGMPKWQLPESWRTFLDRWRYHIALAGLFFLILGIPGTIQSLPVWWEWMKTVAEWRNYALVLLGVVMLVYGMWPGKMIERHQRRRELVDAIPDAVFLLKTQSAELKERIEGLETRVTQDRDSALAVDDNPWLTRFRRLKEKATEVHAYLSNRTTPPDRFTESELDMIIPFKVQLESLRVPCPDPSGFRALEEWRQFMRIILGYIDAEDLSGAQERDWNVDSMPF